MERRLERPVLIGWLVVAIVVIVVAQGMPVPRASDALGPRAFPTVIAAFLALCALWLVAEPWHPAVLRRAEIDLEDEDAEAMADEEGEIITPWRVPVTVGIVAAYVLLIPAIGYRFATLLVCPGMLLMMRVVDPKLLAGVSLVSSFGIYWLFNDLLKVQLP